MSQSHTQALTGWYGNEANTVPEYACHGGKIYHRLALADSGKSLYNHVCILYVYSCIGCMYGHSCIGC